MSRRRQLTTRRLPLVVFLAGLALVAVVSGYVLERYILGSFVSTKATQTKPADIQPQVAKTEITLPATSLWRVQVGVFNSKQQADALAAALKKKGFGAYVSGTGNGPFRVVAGATKTKEAAQKLATSLTKAGYKPYVSEFKYGAGAYTVSLSDAQYMPVFKNTILSMADAVPAEAAAWDYYFAGNKTEFKNSSTGVSTTLTNVAKKLSSATPPKGAETLHSNLIALLEKAAANSNDVKQFAEKGGKDLYVRAMSTYLEVIDAFEQFMAQLPK